MEALTRRHQAIVRTSLISALINLALSAFKILVGVIGHSQALVADGVHSLSDLLSDALVYVAGRHAAQQPDPCHPYGHARYETVATLVLGLLLLAVALGIAWDAAWRLFEPSTLSQPSLLALTAALLSIGVKEWLYWWTLGYAKRVGSELLRANAWHHRSDAISSIVVLLGIAGSIAGLVYLDAIAACIVALMIARIAWDLGWGAVSELVDTGVGTDHLAAIRRTICSVGGVRDIHMLRTRRLGGRILADVHVLVDPEISVSEGHLISLFVEQGLRREMDVTDVTVHIDPEDDQERPSGSLPPLRAEVLARLDELWSGIPEAQGRQRLLLHYLNGRIQIEVFFPLALCYQPGFDPEALRSRLAEALDADPGFSGLQVYFG